MRPQRNDKVVDTVGRVVGSQDDGFILPLVVTSVPVTAVLTNLSQLKATEWFLLFQEVTERGAYADVR